MKFHYLARAIIFENGKVLLAHAKGADSTFLPGGHIEMGEKAELALMREIEEEIGKKAVIKRFIGAVECAWTENEQANHEINLLFEVQVPDLNSSEAPASQESHIEFFWAKPAEVTTHNLLPEPMIGCLMNWEPGFRAYWGSFFEQAGAASPDISASQV